MISEQLNLEKIKKRTTTQSWSWERIRTINQECRGWTRRRKWIRWRMELPGWSWEWDDRRWWIGKHSFPRDTNWIYLYIYLVKVNFLQYYSIYIIFRRNEHWHKCDVWGLRANFKWVWTYANKIQKKKVSYYAFFVKGIFCRTVICSKTLKQE